jgi:small subunit ribosomal protein S2
MPIPDFFILLDKDEEALYELKQLRVPLIGLVDTNMDPNNFLYTIFTNNDSVENIEFFFEFLKEAIKEGRLQEQQKYYYAFLQKLKKNLIKI